jgi:hypothetical protein
MSILYDLVKKELNISILQEQLSEVSDKEDIDHWFDFRLSSGDIVDVNIHNQHEEQRISFQVYETHVDRKGFRYTDTVTGLIYGKYL